jgi:hypothetical protein
LRLELDNFHIRVADESVRSSTTIRHRRRLCVVVFTTVPDRIVGVTSWFLADLGGAIAASHPRLAQPSSEHLRDDVFEARRPAIDARPGKLETRTSLIAECGYRADGSSRGETCE